MTGTSEKLSEYRGILTAMITFFFWRILRKSRVIAMPGSLVPRPIWQSICMMLCRVLLFFLACWVARILASCGCAAVQAATDWGLLTQRCIGVHWIWRRNFNSRRDTWAASGSLCDMNPLQRNCWSPCWRLRISPAGRWALWTAAIHLSGKRANHIPFCVSTIHAPVELIKSLTQEYVVRLHSVGRVP